MSLESQVTELTNATTQLLETVTEKREVLDAAVAAADASKTAAASSAIAAGTSASTATTKATEAASSASAALTSKNAAATSQSEALTSKNSASTSATTATTKASEASASASAAKTSETSAAASASSAASTLANVVPKTRTINGKALSADVVLGIEDLAGLQAALDQLGAGINYSSCIWNQVSDTSSGDGVTNGVTRVHAAMRRCLLNDDGTVNYYLDPFNSNMKADGSPSVLTGADGQVMVEIPKCYVKAVYIQCGSSPIVEWSVSAEPRLGYVVHPAFQSDGELIYNQQLGMWHYVNVTKEHDYIYVGAYHASVFSASANDYIDGLNLDNNTSRVVLANDKLASVSGKYPMVGLTRNQFRTLAAKRGTGWQQWDFWTNSLIQILYLTEYRNLNSQAVIGNGNTTSSYIASSSDQADSPHSVAGKSNAIGNGTGNVNSTAKDTAWMSYRGIENFFGNCWTNCDGVNILDQVYFVANNPASFREDTQTGYTQLGIKAPVANGYIRSVQANTLSTLPLTSSGGGSSIAFSDNYWQGTGWRVLYTGGNAGHGSYAGAFAWFGNLASGDRLRSIGARLVFKR